MPQEVSDGKAPVVHESVQAGSRALAGAVRQTDRRGRAGTGGAAQSALQVARATPAPRPRRGVSGSRAAPRPRRGAGPSATRECPLAGGEHDFKKSRAVLREGIGVRYQFIADHQREHRIGALCRALQVSTSGFYGWTHRPESGRAQANRQLLGRIRALHAEAREAYGIIKTWRALKAEGLRCGRNRVARLRRAHGMIPSMSRKGDCYDNAVAESFFSGLKNELIWHRDFRTREEARSAIFEWIEVFYNRQRLHQTLEYVSPAHYEEQTDVA